MNKTIVTLSDGTINHQHLALLSETKKLMAIRCVHRPPMMRLKN